ncbi:MAG: acyloxyacyl hydrolase [Acidobacteria bacterium]|nr:acyloxyacyl hydrolase [Acidobacteriota bacterium]
MRGLLDLNLTRRRFFALLQAGSLSLATVAWAEGVPATGQSPIQSREFDLYQRGQWEFSLESAYTFRNVPNPFVSAYMGYIRRPNPLQYRFLTTAIAARYRVTNPGGPWLFRGSLQVSATLIGTAIVEGPESHFFGAAIGFRYDFVQPGARLVPYLEIRGGPGVIDSSGIKTGQYQDFMFTYLINAGLRYDFSPRCSVMISAVDQHFSNAGQTEQANGIDSLGVSIGALTRF